MQAMNPIAAHSCKIEIYFVNDVHSCIYSTSLVICMLGQALSRMCSLANNFVHIALFYDKSTVA